MLNRYFIKYRLGNNQIYCERINAQNETEAMQKLLTFRTNANILSIKNLGKGV